MTLLLLILVITALWLLFTYQRQRRERGQAPLSWLTLALIGAGALLLVAVITGRAPAIMAIIGALLALFGRFSGLAFRYWPFISKLWQGYRQVKQPSGGKAQHTDKSQANGTAWLRFLPRQAGEISADARIEQGRFQGQRLSELSLSELRQLALELLRHDPASLQQLLHHWKSSFDPQAQQQADPEQTHTELDSDSQMSVERAYQVLGLTPSASREEVLMAHKRLMHRLHPDKGGSDWLAVQISQAKRTLLQHIGD